LKGKKKIFYCVVCGCRLTERKVHRDENDLIYCTSCFNRTMNKIIISKSIHIVSSPSKPELKYRKKIAKLLGTKY